ncbi:Tn3 family transposase [Streptomyces clavifer]|uniref:Tn3 family transposase n=1 Tax=Streptomyces clavifer TaxID=68188 RepID=UPI003825595A
MVQVKVCLGEYIRIEARFAATDRNAGRVHAGARKLFVQRLHVARSAAFPTDKDAYCGEGCSARPPPSPRRTAGRGEPGLANKDLFYGKDGDLAGADKESQEVSMAALHLLQSALVNTLLMQQVLADEEWVDGQAHCADRRAMSPPFWTHVNPYGRFELDMNSRLDLDLPTRAAMPGPRTPHD